MSPTSGPYQIQSEARGSHWVAWIVRAGSPKPDGSIIIVGETQEEAESKARAWAEAQ